MKSTWKFPFWVQENDRTVTQLTWSFLLVNPSLVADCFSHCSRPIPMLPCLELNQPPPQPHRHLCRSLKESISAWTHRLIPSLSEIIISRPDSGPYQQTLEIHAETLLALLGRHCSSEKSDHSPWG